MESGPSRGPAPGAAPRPSGARRGAVLAAAAAAAPVVAGWLLAALGRPLPEALARALVPAALGVALLAGAGLLVLHAVAAARAGGERARRAAVLALLVAAALALRLLGLGHELGQRAWRDEGTYHRHARAIAAGRPLSPTFVYPHLLYYLDSLALWTADRLPAPLVEAPARWAGATTPLDRDWLVMRLVAALAGALTVLPVFAAARRIAGEEGGGGVGLAAGALAGLLVVVSPPYNRGSHLAIADVPSAFFAALAFAAAARLLEREGRRGYALAGALAGLAAATKYPAGLSALAIVGVWLRHRARHGLRGGEWRSPWGLAVAGAAAVAAFVACLPSLFAFPAEALSGGRGVLFGWRQYAESGWIGVQPESHAAYYGGLLAHGFGLPALVLGAAGAALLPRAARARWAWMLPFPAAFLALIVSMSMVVERNLYPAIPPLAALLGAGAAGWLAALGRRPAPARRGGAGRGALAAATALLALACALPPAARSLPASVAMSRPTTREVALAWIERHVPPGAAVLRESYAPELPDDRYAVWRGRFAARFPLPLLRDHGVDVLVLADNAYGRFLRPELHARPHHRDFAGWYREALALPLAAEVRAGRWRYGPTIRIHRLPPGGAWAERRSFAAADLFVPDAGMREGGAAEAGGALVFRAPGQWAAARADLAPGRWRLVAEGSGPAGGPPAGTLRLRDAENRPLGEVAIAGGGASFRRDAAGRTYLYLDLAPGSRLTGVRLADESVP